MQIYYTLTDFNGGCPHLQQRRINSHSQQVLATNAAIREDTTCKEALTHYRLLNQCFFTIVKLCIA